MALVYKSQGDYTKALEYYEKSLEIELAKLGADHPNVAITYGNMALVYKKQGPSTKRTQNVVETVKSKMK
jgi:tetratricopeptide (TPR) repeat protein